MHVEGYIYFWSIFTTNQQVSRVTGRESFFARTDFLFPGICDAGRKEEERGGRERA